MTRVTRGSCLLSVWTIRFQQAYLCICCCCGRSGAATAALGLLNKPAEKLKETRDVRLILQPFYYRAIPWGLIPGCCGPVSDFIFNDLSGKSICKLGVFDIFSSQFATIVDIQHFQKWSWGDKSQYLPFSVIFSGLYLGIPLSQNIEMFNMCL